MESEIPRSNNLVLLLPRQTLCALVVLYAARTLSVISATEVPLTQNIIYIYIVVYGIQVTSRFPGVYIMILVGVNDDDTRSRKVYKYKRGY